MGGHGHGAPYTIPKYTEFNIKGIPQLEELEKALAQKGLKDPWIRNEAWRYHPGFGTKLQRARKLFFRGLPLGLALTVATVAFDKLIGGEDHDHGHH
ncbi:NADH dehydrogenase [ubiquinone] 1 beta subcomplex subunit 3 [Danaus plexippus]|uniref:NADH dehydrogenase [ubiquinone] 1 beta subcomplex subunit 3 n=1 Tax=Danaus plexippus TaxID=13037 RepID=UPI002AB32581|nr:NADH dehydrogenase [ubiquinone] 1 beta subcomplex subunit 3 [Danaus plexippus]XP_061380512.1 NADH dehydrogenase [ubiquinone] 1 beta subcomplex subunit 3 [Danaus plexippus]